MDRPGLMARLPALRAGVVLAAALLPACAAKPERPADADIQAARRAAMAFDQRLREQIFARLDRDEDPVAVFLAYADNAPQWGKEISDAAQLDFSRTAIGVRNPADEPDNWERRQMEEFAFLMDAGVDPATLETAEIVTEGREKVFRWMRPTPIEETCLVCHGEKLPPRLKLLLDQEYPLDQARDYGVGQLGGAYSVRKVLSVDGKPAPPWRPKPAPPRRPPDPRGPGDAPLVLPATPPAAAPDAPSPSP